MTPPAMPPADAVLADLGEAVIVTALDRSVLYWNRAAERLYGWPAHEVMGRDVVKVTRAEVDDEHDSRVLRNISRGEPTLENYWIRRRDGERIPVSATITALRSEDGDVAAVAIVATAKPSTEAAGTGTANGQAALEHLALHDEITGLPNRALLHDRLDRAMVRARRSGRRVAVVFGGIDGFRSVNERLGSAAGDKLLLQVGSRLSSATRASDTVAHHAGDEFVVLCEDIDDAETASEISKRMAVLCDAPFAVGGQSVTLTITWGVTIAGPADTPASCLRDAANAMRIAKRANGGELAVAAN